MLPLLLPLLPLLLQKTRKPRQPRNMLRMVLLWLNRTRPKLQQLLDRPRVAVEVRTFAILEPAHMGFAGSRPTVSCAPGGHAQVSSLAYAKWGFDETNAFEEVGRHLC